jgi:catechol 2,3-dioxygenase-like lactoylglutathione lyase family enzyme
MFKETKAFSSFAVDDLEKAREFYGTTLGMDVADDEMGFLTLRIAGDRPTLIYPRPNFEPATYTILNFPVEDIDAAVDALMERGVAFEIYPDSGQDEKGVMRQNGPPIAWFRDPAGNILSILQLD